jgi:hypothetical protein
MSLLGVTGIVPLMLDPVLDLSMENGFHLSQKLSAQYARIARKHAGDTYAAYIASRRSARYS